MSKSNGFVDFMKMTGGEIKTTVLNKRYGFYVFVAAFGLTFIQMISYACIGDLFNGGVIAACVVGMLLSAGFTLFRKTERLAPVVLMICDFLCIVGFAATDGMIDYITTQFFDGFSIGAIFTVLPAAMWFSVLMFILSFLTSSVAMYLPQGKKEKLDDVKAADKTTEVQA